MYALKNARVRAGPTTTVEVLTTLDKGSRVIVTGRVEGRDWYRVALANGDTGFVRWLNSWSAQSHLIPKRFSNDNKNTPINC